MNRSSVWMAAWSVNRTIPICLLGLLVANILLFLFLSYVMEGKASAVQARYIYLQAEERLSQRGGNDAGSDLVLYSRGLEDLKKFRLAIPAKSELSGLVDELFSLADKAGLTINSVQYEPEVKPEQKMLNYTIRYQVTGTYNQVKKMIHLIEQSKRLIAIDELTLGSARKDEAVNLALSLTTFFRTDSL